PRPLLAGASVVGAPPSRSNRLSEPPAKKPIERPSGDQKGLAAPSVPPRGWAVVVDSSRSHRRDALSSDATETISRPSGERANEAGSPVAGVTRSTRVSSGGVSRRYRTAGMDTAAAASSATTKAAIHGSVGRLAADGRDADSWGVVSNAPSSA